MRVGPISFNKAAYKEHRRKIEPGLDNEMQPLIHILVQQ